MFNVRPKKTTKMVSVGLAVVLSLTAAACGGDDDSSDPATGGAATASGTATDTGAAGTAPGDGTATAGTEATAATADTSGTSGTASSGTASGPSEDFDPTAILRVGTPISANQGPMFDMSDHNQGSSVQWLDLIYDTMIKKTTRGLEPRLATAWQIVDATTLDIELRDGVEFQDGETFDAAAVANAWNRPKPDHLRAEVKAVENVEVLEPLKVRVHFSEPVAGDFVNLTMVDSYFPVPSPAALAQYGDDYESHPVGVGPYEFESYEVDQKISLRRWDGYWDPSTQVLGGVDFIQVAPGAPTITALGAGQVDLAQIASSEAAAAEGIDGVEVFTQASPSVLTLNLCVNQPPFDVVEARQAVAHLVDRDEINQGVYQGLGSVSDQWQPVDSDLYSEAVADRYPHDIEKARELWEASGAPDSITILGITASQDLVRTAEILQAQFAQIDVDVNVATAPNSQDVSTVNPEAAPYPIRPATWYTYFGDGGFLNWCGYNNPEFYETMQFIGGGEGSDAEIGEAWDRAAQILADDLPGIWLVAGPVLVAHSDKVSGVEFIRPTFGMAADLRGVGILAG